MNWWVSFFSDDLNIREFINGMWFFICVVMLITLLCLGGHRIEMLARRNRPKAYFMGGVFACFRHDLALQIIAGLIFFVSGSGMRAGYIWLLLHCQNLPIANCTTIEHAAWTLFVAAALAIVGGTYTVRSLSPLSWRPWSWLPGVIIALTIPLVLLLAAG